MVVNFVSRDGPYNDIYISNYANVYIKDEILRVPRRLRHQFSGPARLQHSCLARPTRLASRNMTALDVAQAIGDQNLAAASGQIGQPPVPAGQSTQVPIDTLGRLTDPEQFEEIIVKVNQTTAPNLAATPSARCRESQAGGRPMPWALSSKPWPPRTALLLSPRQAAGPQRLAPGGSSTDNRAASPAWREGGAQTTSTATSTAAINPTGPTSVFPAGGSTGGGAAAGGGGTTSGGAATGGGGTDLVIARHRPARVAPAQSGALEQRHSRRRSAGSAVVGGFGGKLPGQ